MVVPETPGAGSPLISRGNLKKSLLKGEVALVTGAGRGIGYEAAKALLWLGANVIIAEVDANSCRTASEALQGEFRDSGVVGVQADIGNEDDVARVSKAAGDRFGHVDIVLNNAASLDIGAVKEAKIAAWDRGYHVIVRGPVLLAREFLPGMVARKHGVFVCVSSSGAAPYMGPYEVFKTAQVELANTLASELEGTGVCAYSIGPGIVRTPGFMEGGSKVAALMGISTEQLLDMNRSALLTVEEAGVGFAASIARANRYNGTETSSIQVLRDIGIGGTKEETAGSEKASQGSSELFSKVAKTYAEQSKGWKEMNLFKRQWVTRDFKKQTGMSMEEMGGELDLISRSLKSGMPSKHSIDAVRRLSAYYNHQAELLKGFEKDSKKLDEGLRAIQYWMDEIRDFLETPGQS